jgi:hypothetical protein
MRIMGRTWELAALIAAGLILSNGTLSAADAPMVHVNAVVKNGNVQLEVEADGPFEYTTYRPSASLYVIDLSGVAAADPAGVHVVASNLVKSYRVTSFAAGDKPEVRVEILLKQGVEPRLQRKGSQNLTLLVSRGADASSPAPSTPSPAAAAIVRAAVKSSDGKNPGASVGAIEQVRLAQNGGATEVTISGSGPLTYHALHLQDPDRLVLDFAGSHLSTPENQIASNLDPVRQIRLGQFTPETSRVVIDLSEPARYSIKGEGSTVTVTLSRRR